MFRLPTRSPEVLSLAALLSGAAAVLLLAVLFPFSPGAPIALGWVLFAVALVLAVGTLLAGRRLPRTVLAVEAGIAVVLNSVLVGLATTPAGAVLDAVAYLWLAVYVAVFFPAIGPAFAAFTSAGFGAGLLAGGLPSMLTAWALVTISTLVLAIVLARVSRGVRRHLHEDPLTGALNRRGLEAAATAAFARTRRRAETLTLAVLDLDDFKAVNDRAGHAHGDRILAESAVAWRTELRADDVLARIGGDEFVVLMPMTTPEQARGVLDRLRAHSATGWSTGVARWADGETLAACLERADTRLYEAKARRRQAEAA